MSWLFTIFFCKIRYFAVKLPPIFYAVFEIKIMKLLIHLQFLLNPFYSFQLDTVNFMDFLCQLFFITKDFWCLFVIDSSRPLFYCQPRSRLQSGTIFTQQNGLELVKWGHFCQKNKEECTVPLEGRMTWKKRPSSQVKWPVNTNFGEKKVEKKLNWKNGDL